MDAAISGGARRAVGQRPAHHHGPDQAGQASATSSAPAARPSARWSSRPAPRSTSATRRRVDRVGDTRSLEQAQALISGLTMEPEVGQYYNGVVKRIIEIGAFVEILPGTDGLLHISEISNERIRAVEDVLKEGDEVIVKCVKVDRDGKIRLSRREVLEANPGPEEINNFVV
jgi:hypothetical protein